MRTASTIFTALLLFLPLTAQTKMYAPPVSFGTTVLELEAVERRELPPLDNLLLLQEAQNREEERIGPRHVAETIAVALTPETAGTWETLANGSRLWRLRVTSPAALHLSLGLSRFDLPAGARLWIYDPAGEHVEGPYTMAHRSSRGRLFTPPVPGSEIVVELHLPLLATSTPELEIGRVHHGFRDFFPGGLAAKGTVQGRCNVDVVCPEGDEWRDQIRSVGLFMHDGGFTCTGQLLNNTAGDDRPLFLTAWHCGVEPENADSVVVFWNYEAPTCGQLGGGSLDQNQTGATLLATWQPSDFALLELSRAPDPEFGVHLVGWDARGEVPAGSIGIHHPTGQVKAISFNDDPLGTIGVDISRTGPPRVIPTGDTHWEVDNWETGTTEQGSSGSCILDPLSKRCLGVLSAGSAFCIGDQPNDREDFYGKLSVAWEGGGTPESRLRDWLDPAGGGATRILDGQDPTGGGNGGACVPSDEALCLRDGRFEVRVRRAGSDGVLGPARVVDLGRANNDESGLFWFFQPDNWEMLIKVLEGCSVNNHFWVFAASATDVEWRIIVTDTETGEVKRYDHAAGTPSPAITDTAAFASCP